MQLFTLNDQSDHVLRVLFRSIIRSERSFKEGTPDKTFFQSQLGFESERWTLIRHYTHFRWTGYISFPHGGDFQLHVRNIECVSFVTKSNSSDH